MESMQGLNLIPENSKKLKELCACLMIEKIPFYYSQNNRSRNSRYQYYIVAAKYDKPYNFPVFRNPPISLAQEQTIIYDEETKERIDIPFRAQVMIRIKGPRVGSAIQAFVREGHVEVSDIRKVQVATFFPEFTMITLVCYLDPEEVRKSSKPNEKLSLY